MSSRDQRRSSRKQKRAAQKARRERSRDLRANPFGEPMTMSVPRERLGPPGIPYEIHVVASDKPGPQEQDKARLSDTRLREFRIFVHLGVSISIAPRDVALLLDPTAGSSLLKAPAGAVFTALDTPRGRLLLHTNKALEVSAVEFTCRVQSRGEALRLYGEEVAPLLDHISFLLDVPVLVASIAWIDQANQTWGAHYTSPYSSAEIGGAQGKFGETLRPYYALYREAVTNPSVFYQFLCFCKILEGAFRSAVPRLFADARRRGIELKRSTPKVPPMDKLDASAESCACEGKSISDAYDSFLQPEFRNALAHFAADGQEPLQVSSYTASSRVSGALPLARYCAREAITMLESYVAQLPPTDAASRSKPIA